MSGDFTETRLLTAEKAATDFLGIIKNSRHTPIKELSLKPKTHILVHLRDHVQRFGSLSLGNTSRYGSLTSWA